MTEISQKAELLALTTQIVTAHLGRTKVEAAELPGLIRQIYDSLAGTVTTTEAPAPNRPDPAVPVKRSVTPEYIVCLEDGKKLKMLKRHLMTAYGMTPDQYRERWGLPADYPMVAPNYANQRRELAKQIGLGTGRRKARR